MLWCNTVIPDDLSNQLSWRGNGQCQSQEHEGNPQGAGCEIICLQGKIFLELKSLTNQRMAYCTKAWQFPFIFNLCFYNWLFLLSIWNYQINRLPALKVRFLSKYHPESSWEDVDVVLETFHLQQVLCQINFPITISYVIEILSKFPSPGISLRMPVFQNVFCGVTSHEELLSLSTGYSSLVLDSTGANLFANCTDDSIYMFNMTSLRTIPGKHDICGNSCKK